VDITSKENELASVNKQLQFLTKELENAKLSLDQHNAHIAANTARVDKLKKASQIKLLQEELAK
jgi:hypothetical protein